MTTNDDEKKKLAAWSTTLGSSGGAVPGSSKEMIRKAMALNPKLRAGMSSTEVLAAIKQTGPAETAGSAAASQDILGLFQTLKDEFAARMQHIADEQARLEQSKRELIIKTREQAVRTVLRIDPNLLSPKTQLVLQDEKSFLKEIGVDARTIVEQGRKGI